MKVNELMIGDWIEQIQDFVSFAPIQIEEVRKDCVVFSNGICHLKYDEIKPISLTEEILVKNGFEYAYNPVSKMPNKRLMEATINGNFIEIRLDKKNVAVWLDYDENNDGIYSDYLFPLPYYLHNFQHLLRLCGIEKEIEL